MPPPSAVNPFLPTPIAPKPPPIETPPEASAPAALPSVRKVAAKGTEIMASVPDLIPRPTPITPPAAPIAPSRPITPPSIPQATSAAQAQPQPQGYAQPVPAYRPPFGPGATVLVAWADGNRYPATVQQVAGNQVSVVFPDGRQLWVDSQYVASPY
ncbi:MAG: hypothetical protein WCI05_17665 [Myxococcales bacterium]